MKKTIVLFFAVMAIATLICGIHAYNAVDLFEVQRLGVSYYDALKMDAHCRTESYYLFFTAFMNVVAAFIVPKLMK